MEVILELIQDGVRDRGSPEIGTSVARGHTGRVSESFTAEQQVCERMVNEWLDSASDDSSMCGRRLISELISERPRCAAPQTFRARSFSETTRPTDPLEFGPAPSRPQNRYNRAGQSALYLGMDVPGLGAEMAEQAKPGEHYYYARYLPVDSLSLVDLSDASAHAALHLAFDRAERLDLNYESAQRLADVVRELHIDGIIVPGVRGTIDYHYSNVVIFNCADWAMWVDPSHPPELLTSR